MNNELILPVLRDTAAAAGQVIMQRFAEGGFRIEQKGELANLVTEIDIESENFIRRILDRCFPDIPVIGEESADGESVKNKSCFIVDPIDGTLNFSYGYPEFAVSIAYWSDSLPVAGVVCNPHREEVFSALRGNGASLNGVSLTGSSCTALGQAMLFSGWPYDKTLIEISGQVMAQVVERSREVRIIGSAALAPCYVAAGRGDGFFEAGLSPWDLAAGVLIAEESGMSVTDIDGSDFDLDSGRVLITSPKIKEEIIPFVSRMMRS